MVYVWGGSFTWTEIAERFGWPAVIWSVVTWPFMFLWINIFVFPLLFRFRCCNGKVWQRVHYTFEGNKNVIKDNLYSAPKKYQARCGVEGWSVHVDLKGGKSFEMFWGCIQAMDLTEMGPNQWVMSGNWSTLVISDVVIDFAEDGASEDVHFGNPFKGPYGLNPLVWLHSIWVFSSIGYALKFGIGAKFERWSDEAKAPPITIEVMPIPASDIIRLNAAVAAAEQKRSAPAAEQGKLLGGSP